MRVVIAEKPSVAKEVARVLGAGGRRDGYWEGNGVQVTWAVGHLVGFAEPDGYKDQEWGQPWAFENLPMVPPVWRLEPRGDDGLRRQLDVIRGLLREANDVVCATDAGREGELIYRLIIEFCGAQDLPAKRLWVSSLTDEALRKGFDGLQDGVRFEPLAEAAWARAQADWLVGMNLSRAYTLRHGVSCPVGRVQTPTLAMVVARDRERASFTKSVYYEVRAVFGAAEKKPFEAVHVFESLNDKGQTVWESHLGEAQARQVAEQAVLSPAHVSSADPKEKRKAPPQLFDLTGLQRFANSRFGWTAAKTLEVAQRLYEDKILTYPRTESRHLPQDMVPLFAPTLKALAERLPVCRKALGRLLAGNRPGKRYVDGTKVADHHAIVPTGMLPAASFNDKDDGVRLFQAVVARYAGMFLADYRYEETIAWLEASGNLWFRARGIRVLDYGWREVEQGDDDDDDDGGVLPALYPGESLSVDEPRIDEKETRPPAAFSDASLLAAMENAGSRLEEETLRRDLKEAGGLGTPATRASIIEGLLKRGYLRRDDKRLLSTDKGSALVDAVEAELRDPAWTARWEGLLRKVEKEPDAGRARALAQSFYGEVVDYLTEAVPRVRDREVPSPAGFAGASVGTCPKCGERPVVESKKAFGCIGWRAKVCDFTLWKEYMNKQLTNRQVTDILAGKAVRVKQLRGRSGKVFDARLRLKLGGYNQLELVFDDGDKRSSGRSSGSRPQVRRGAGRGRTGAEAARQAASPKHRGR